MAQRFQYDEGIADADVCVVVHVGSVGAEGWRRLADDVVDDGKAIGQRQLTVHVGITLGEIQVVCPVVFQPFGIGLQDSVVLDECADGQWHVVGGSGDDDGGCAALVLSAAKGSGVVAAGTCRFVAHEGGAAAGYLRLAVSQGGRGEEHVAESEGAIIALPAYEACAIGRGRRAAGEQFAVEHAALDGEFGVDVIADQAYQSAVGTVVRGIAVYGGADAAILNPDRAPLGADEAAGVLLRGADEACDVQVLDHAAVLDVTEGRGIVLVDGAVVGAVADGERVALSVERSGEVVIALARHALYGDVRAQQDGLAVEDALVVVGQHVAERVPARGGVDGVGVAVDCQVVGGVCPCRLCGHREQQDEFFYHGCTMYVCWLLAFTVTVWPSRLKVMASADGMKR